LMAQMWINSLLFMWQMLENTVVADLKRLK
jgi:hypothetical protein